MRRDFVKGPDREFEAQVAQFLANLGPVKTALGLPANWEAQLQTRKNNFTTALNSLDLAEANYPTTNPFWARCVITPTCSPRFSKK